VRAEPEGRRHARPARRPAPHPPRGGLHRIHRGVYAVGHTRLTREARFLAAVKACGPGTVLSHRSAAILHELLSPDGHPIEDTAPSRHRVPGIVVLRRASA
jgi:hypothetical protein